VMWRRSKKLYKKRYHRRSLAETAVSTVKRRFNHTLYSKKRRGQKNELRLKVITYNLSIIARLPARFQSRVSLPSELTEARNERERIPR